MRLIKAPEVFEYNSNDVKVFLAGGISNCEDWQSKVAEELQNEPDDLILIDPRSDKFDTGDDRAEIRQISWEFKMLENCDIFSMYFCGSESVQPICMYELGRNIVRMQNRFPTSDEWGHRIVITADPKYKRYKDVFIQGNLATGMAIYINESLDEHIYQIRKSYHRLRRDPK